MRLSLIGLPRYGSSGRVPAASERPLQAGLGSSLPEGLSLTWPALQQCKQCQQSTASHCFAGLTPCIGHRHACGVRRSDAMECDVEADSSGTGWWAGDVAYPHLQMPPWQSSYPAELAGRPPGRCSPSAPLSAASPALLRTEPQPPPHPRRHSEHRSAPAPVQEGPD